MSNLAVGSPLPKSIGACADLYNDVRTVRLAMDKEAKAVKDRETEIREHIIANLGKSEDTGAAGKRYRAQIVVKDVVRVVDWGLLHSWIRKNDRFDMLQKRLGETAATDWIAEEKRMLPGCEVIKVPDVSITKI